VAELVKRNGDWHIVDSGTSLEGVTREGTRVEDEALVAGVPYQVGGFELVMQGDDVPRRTADRPMPASGAAASQPIMKTMMEDTPLVPRTMMETDSTPIIPRTMFEAPMPQQHVAQPVAPSPMQVPPAVRVAPVAAAPMAKRKNLKPLIFALAGGVVLLLVLAVLTSGKKKPKVEPPVASTTTTTTTAPAVVAQRPATGDEQISRLQIDEALNSWEAQLKQKDDQALRDRFCIVASEVAAVHAASGDPGKAREYYKRIVAVGSPNSDMVKLAQAKL
jgi:hypothetical protein